MEYQVSHSSDNVLLFYVGCNLVDVCFFLGIPSKRVQSCRIASLISHYTVIPFHVDNFTGIPVVIQSSVFVLNKKIPYCPALYLNYTCTAASYTTTAHEHSGPTPLTLRLGTGHGPEKIVLISLPHTVKLKGKVPPVLNYSTKPWWHMGSEGVISPFFTATLDSGEWPASRPDRITPKEMSTNTNW